jgi:hypothetical protein
MEPFLMVSQHHRFTKPFLALGLLLALWAGSLPSFALIKMDKQSVNAALVYGMKNQKLGLSHLLGPNWVENGDGALLNIYSPFMMLATKAARAGLPIRPTSGDLEKARKRFGKEVAFYSDPKNRLTVKFAVSFYGNSPDFAKRYAVARIVGIGRGKSFDIRPTRQLLDQIADPVGQASTATAEKGSEKTASDVPPRKAALYEAINAYYFHLADLLDLQEFQFTLESPSGPPITFRLNNERLY